MTKTDKIPKNFRTKPREVRRKNKPGTQSFFNQRSFVNLGGERSP